MPDIVAESGGGWVYDTDDDLIRALDRALAEPERRDAMGRQARQTFAEHWAPDAHLNAYFNLIERAAAARAA
jgi:glycosyltransferase involved in cell wall biosynthesis